MKTPGLQHRRNFAQNTLVLKPDICFTRRSLAGTGGQLSIIHITLFALVLWLFFVQNCAFAEQVSPAPGTNQPIKIKTEIKDYVVTLGATRVIYDPNGHGEELWVENSQDYPMLVQSRTLDESTKKSAPFIVTPPLFRLDGHQRGRLRIVRTGGNFPADRESIQWLCVKAIPPSGGDAWAKSKKNDKGQTIPTLGMKVSLNNCIKLFTRPASIHGSPTDVAGNVKWHQSGNHLSGKNDSPFYINLYTLKMNGVGVSQPHYIPPYSTQEFTLPAHVQGVKKVQWQIVTDTGSKSVLYEAAVG